MDMDNIVNGYGVDMTYIKYRDDACQILYNMLKEADSSLYKLARAYKHDSEPLPEDCSLDDYGKWYQGEILTFCDFVESYYNDDKCWGGIEGLLVDFINEQECSKMSSSFQFDDCCIYVPCFIPSEKDKYLTQERIVDIFSRYLFPLTEKPQAITWLDINLNA